MRFIDCKSFRDGRGGIFDLAVGRGEQRCNRLAVTRGSTLNRRKQRGGT